MKTFYFDCHDFFKRMYHQYLYSSVFLLSATTRKINALDNEFELYWHHNDATVFPFVFQNTLKEQ